MKTFGNAVHALAGCGLFVVIAIVVALQVFFRTRHGVVFSFDSWVYWESALALAGGDGYVTVTGEPIKAWPVLFPLFLAGWDRTFGLDMAGVRAVLVFLSLVAGIVWARVWHISSQGLKSAYVLIGYFFIICYLPVWYDNFLSESLWVPLIGILFLAIDSSKLGALRFAGVALVLALCLLCRNQSVALIPAFAAFLLLRFGLARCIPHCLAMLISLAVWVVVRQVQGQSDSHVVALHGGIPYQDLLSLVVRTGNLFAVSTAHLSTISLIFVALLLALLVTRTRFVSTAESGVSSGFAWLGFSAVFWCTTAVISVAVSMPVETQRFYYFPVFIFLLGALQLAAVSKDNWVSSLATAVVVLTVLSSAYRAVYFLQHRSMMISLYPPSFEPDKEWVKESVASIDAGLDKGGQLSALAGQFGVAPSTYRRWKSMPLAPEEISRALDQ